MKVGKYTKTLANRIWFYKRMYKNKQNTIFWKKIRNKNDSACVCVVCFTVCSRLEPIWKPFIEF